MNCADAIAPDCRQQRERLKRAGAKPNRESFAQRLIVGQKIIEVVRDHVAAVLGAVVALPFVDATKSVVTPAALIAAHGAPRVVAPEGSLEDVFVALTGRHLREE